MFEDGNDTAKLSVQLRNDDQARRQRNIRYQGVQEWIGRTMLRIRGCTDEDGNVVENKWAKSNGNNY